MGRRWTLRSPHTASSRLVRAPTAHPGSLSLCGSPAGSASPCCSENPAAAKEGTLLTTGDQVAKSPCGCIKAAGKWGPNTRLQGLSLGGKTCNICLCAHPTAPGPAITQLRMASEEGQCLGTTRVPGPQALKLPCTLIPLLPTLIITGCSSSIPCGQTFVLCYQ